MVLQKNLVDSLKYDQQEKILIHAKKKLNVSKQSKTATKMFRYKIYIIGK